MKRLLIGLFLLFGVFVQGNAFAETPNATFTVDSSADDSDTVINGICATSANECTLRAAIQEANATAALDTIQFSIAPTTRVRVNTQLPSITQPVNIIGEECPDALDDFPGGQVLEFDGAGSGVEGLTLSVGSGGSTIRGLNIIDFSGDGIQVASNNNTIRCNTIGVWRVGQPAHANGLMGIRISGDNNTIGGLLETERNTIDGNTFAGVGIINGTGNKVYGNFVGIGRYLPTIDDYSTGNGGNGVYIEGGSNNQIGNNTFARRNIIANNGANGVRVNGGSGHLIRYNHIGMDVVGTAAFGNSDAGVSVVDGNNVVISNNVISGNDEEGILLTQTTTNTTIESNTIGLDVNGDPLGNMAWGISLGGSGVQGTTIGSNVISANHADGILVTDDATENTITKNSIYGNLAAGIDLNKDGIDKNDEGDPDGGSNLTQNYPILTEASNIGHIEGVLDSSADTHRVEFFQNDSCEEVEEFGEGQTYLGSVNVTTLGDGTLVPFSVDFVPFAAGFVTATATDSNGNTSEFSQCIEIDIDPIPLEVNSAGDAGDGDLTDGICSTAARADECTLRAALEQTNAFATSTHITFADEYTIVPQSPLPSITTPTEIDGVANRGCSTDPEVPHDLTIILDGIVAGAAHGLHFDIGSGGSEVSGLEIGRFDQNGIQSDSNNNQFICNHIGVSKVIEKFGNRQDGIFITGDGNLVGNGVASGRNVISGNLGDGVVINSSVNSRVRGNYIGTTLTGLDVESNSGTGVYNDNSPTTIIGGLGLNDGNVIGGNEVGVRLLFGADATNRAQVLGNFIGISKTGGELPNAQEGVLITNGAEFLLQNNDIYHSGRYGVFVDDYFGDIQPTQNEILDNDILYNDGGVYVGALTAVTVAGNVIGGNGVTPGVMIACDTAVASECADGVADGNSNVIIEDNFIGVASNGTTVYSASGIGMHLVGAEDVIVRRNTIAASSGSADMHVESDGSGNPSMQITIDANEIGISADGNTNLNNGANGLIIDTGTLSTTVSNNLIGADSGTALTVASDNIIVHNNAIGTNSAGTLAAGGAIGLHIDGSDTNLVYNNIIGHNGIGVKIEAGNDNLLYGNAIGTDATGTVNAGNSSYGVQITNDSDRNKIGDDETRAYNIIRNNGDDGIAIFDTTGGVSRQNTLFASQFGNNAGLPIDLGPSGITANDSCDLDAGQNDLQNFPVLSGVNNNGDVAGTLETNPSRDSLRIDVFSSASCDGVTGEAEGEEWYGSAIVQTGLSGLTSFTVPKLSASAALPYFTAIVTDLETGNTSEFSSCYQTSVPTAVGLQLAEAETGLRSVVLISAVLALTFAVVWLWRHQRMLLVVLALCLFFMGGLSSNADGVIALVPVAEASTASCVQFNDVLSDGSSIEGGGGVVLGALPGTLEENLQVSIEVMALPDPAYTGPGSRVTDYYQITPEINVEAPEDGGFLVGIPLPNGISGNDVAVAIWTPEDVMEDQVVGGAWFTAPVTYDPASGLATFHLTNLANTGTEVTLLTDPQFDPIPEPSSRAPRSPDSAPNFVITCSTEIAVCDEAVKNEMEAVFRIAYDEIVTTMGFRPPALAHSYFYFDTNPNNPLGIPIPSSTPYAGSTYYGITVLDKSADQCDNLKGSYGPYSRTIHLCLEAGGIDGTDMHETITHEFFHAIQHAYPKKPKDTPEANKWVIEGTATAAQFLPLYNVRSSTRDWARTDRRLNEYNESTLYHYRAQDFWIFGTFIAGSDLRYLHDMFENYGTSLHRVAQYFDNTAPFGSFSDQYWGYARNHAYEHIFDFNGSFPSPCYLATVNPHNIAGFPTTITHNHLVRPLEIELGLYEVPLRTSVWEIDVEVGVQMLEIEVIPHESATGGEVRWKVYEANASNCGSSFPPGTRQFSNVAANSKYYVIVSNANHNLGSLNYDLRVESFVDE